MWFSLLLPPVFWCRNLQYSCSDQGILENQWNKRNSTQLFWWFQLKNKMLLSQTTDPSSSILSMLTVSKSQNSRLVNLPALTRDAGDWTCNLSHAKLMPCYWATGSLPHKNLPKWSKCIKVHLPIVAGRDPKPFNPTLCFEAGLGSSKSPTPRHSVLNKPFVHHHRLQWYEGFWHPSPCSDDLPAWHQSLYYAAM